MEWIGVPWTNQETRQFVCDAVYWKPICRASFWYTCSSRPHIEAHPLTHVIMDDLPLHTIGEKKLLPTSSCAKDSATRKGAKRVIVESHDFIMAEIFRREAHEDVGSANNTDSAVDVDSCSSCSSSVSEKSSSSDSE